MSEFKVGDKYHDEFGVVTIRSVFDGYVAFRRPRCAMAILKENYFLSRFKKIYSKEEIKAGRIL